MELKHFIRHKRDELKLTQKQAAEKVGVSSLTWTSWERGQMPSLKHIFKIADWAGVTVDQLRPYVEAMEKSQ